MISVIIPTYNRGRLIFDSANSVLNQTYKNIELIIVDDCSTDDTERIVGDMRDQRLHYVRLEKNSGACAARNRGIECASGNFIAFNDSDDLWLPEKLERQFDFLKKNDADIALCKMECRTSEHEFVHNFPNIEQSGQIFYQDLLKYNSASTQTLFGKAKCFKAVPFDETMPRMQDWDEALRLSQRYKIFYQNEILVHTFFQKDSISAHPEKGVAAMETIFAKHKDVILSSPEIAKSFIKKKMSFVCDTGKNPLIDALLLKQIAPSFDSELRYVLAKLGVYAPLMRLKKRISSWQRITAAAEN